MTTTSGARPVRAPRGTELSCRGWPQEAAMRMLQNNLDPEVAEHPDQLVVYGGTGRPRGTGLASTRSFDAANAAGRRDDAGAVRQAGRGFATHEWAPRVLLANSNLVASGPPGRSSGGWRRSG